MSIYYENGCFRLWSVDALEEMPKVTAKKIARMIGRNQNRQENEEMILIFCDWLIEKIAFFSRKFAADRADKAAEKQLKFFLSLSDAL